MRPWSAEEFASLLASPHVHLLESNHAFALTRIVTDESELLTIATDPAHRRQGLARALLDTLEIHARDNSAKTLFLEVAEDNAPAHALYTAAGYQEVARRPGYYQTPQGRVDALILTKTL